MRFNVERQAITRAQLARVLEVMSIHNIVVTTIRSASLCIIRSNVETDLLCGCGCAARDVGGAV